MKKCTDCQGIMKKLHTSTPEGIGYTYFRCSKCGEETLNLDQLHKVASRYRSLKTYHLKLSRWGLSLGVRIPKEVAKEHHLESAKEVILVSEEQGIKIIPA